ncbi:hypothetical protein G7054_g13135 [Neopestalotiopsis clavispora]|nr:hypothetical protein G7054_g13135 [Neopestalotiopsis clavispora]
MIANRSLIFTAIPDFLVVAGKHIQIRSSHFDLAAPPPVDGFTAELLYASLDPHLRNLMVRPNAPQNGFSPLPVGEVIPSTVLVRILLSNSPLFVQGALAVGFGSVQEYQLVTKEAAVLFQPLPNLPGVEPHVFLGPLGIPGLTAFAALYEVGEPRPGKTIFISAASGAVGQMVGQLAKREGMRVIGSVGSDEKVKLLKETFGFHAAFNYRSAPVVLQLKEIAPEGIDSEHLEAAIENLNELGRISMNNQRPIFFSRKTLANVHYSVAVACGYASEYSAPKEKYGIRNTNQIIGKRITWRGIEIFHDGLGDKYRSRLFSTVPPLIADGSFKITFDVTEGFENAPQGLAALLEGKNMGKAILAVKQSE